MNLIEDFIIFLFTLIFMSVLNSSYSFGMDEVSCANPKLTHLDSKYIFVGEDHRDYKAKDFLIKYLDAFKSQGFNSIFVEYVESSSQYILDNYNLDPKSFRESAFRTYGQPGDWGYDPTAYLLLTDHIGIADINIYGLDRRSDLRINMNQDVKMAIRDQHMFDLVKQFITLNPNEKIIFLNGSSHAFLNTRLLRPSFYQLFKEHYSSAKTTNIKVDYFGFDSVSSERLIMSQQKSHIECPDDFILYSPTDRPFDYYIFENTLDFLPTIDEPISYQI